MSNIKEFALIGLSTAFVIMSLSACSAFDIEANTLVHAENKVDKVITTDNRKDDASEHSLSETSPYELTEPKEYIESFEKESLYSQEKEKIEKIAIEIGQRAELSKNSWKLWNDIINSGGFEVILVDDIYQNAKQVEEGIESFMDNAGLKNKKALEDAYNISDEEMSNFADSIARAMMEFQAEFN